MDDRLIDSDRLDLSRKSLIPGAGFFVPDSIASERADAAAAEDLAGTETVVVADDDADGLACAALIREAVGADAAFEGESGVLRAGPIALLSANPYAIASSLDRVATHAADAETVYVCDLCPDAYDEVGAELEAVIANGADVRWLDHHDWDDEVAASVREAGADLVLGESDEECAADVVARSLDHEFPLALQELLDVTRDHDLWIREDDRSDDLADYARWADPDEYLAIVADHGPDLPEDVKAYVAEQRVEKEALVDLAVERATMHEIGPWTVAATYGRCSQNEVAEALRPRGADAAVVVKPAGSASIRGTDAFERCQEVARQVNGGGHPRAAGCKPDIYDDMLDYATHWTTRGATAKRVILRGFERLADEEADSEGAAVADEPAADD
jgi:oligoribonuclease NrnB/cAMP/cGMP phosphodiesterase (DHH superfamily)